MSLIALLGCGSSSYLVESVELTPVTQRVRITHAGAAVDEAVVSINGEAATHEGNGVWAVQRSIPLAEGDFVYLFAQIGEETLTGTGAIASAPLVTAPAAHVPISDPLIVKWEYPTIPDGFQVVIAWEGGTLTYDVDGGARSHTVDAGPLPVDVPILVSVAAKKHGQLIGRVADESSFIVAGVRGGLETERTSFYRVMGTVMGNRFQNIRITRNNFEPVTDAIVSVNGVEASFVTANENYHCELPTTLSVGDELLLQIVHGENVIEGRGAIPAVATVTAPADAAVLPAAEPFTVSWTLEEDPDVLEVSFSWLECDAAGCGGKGRTYIVPPAGRSVIVPAGELPSGQDLELTVVTYEQGAFVGLVTEESNMRISSRTPPRTVRIE